MGQRIGVSKVARMLGIKRSELNKRLSAANIKTFEGDVDFEQVKCIAPLLDLGDANIDRVQRIRDSATYTGSGETHNISGNAQDKIRHLSNDLAIEAQMSREYLALIEDIAAKLGELQTSDNEERRRIGFELCEWLRNKVNTS